MSADRIKGFSHWGRLVRVGLTIHLLSVDLFLWLLNSPGGGDGPPSPSFFFTSSFSFWRARISSSFFCAISSFLLFISVISLCSNISSVICSASDILSLAMLWVDTIYFLLRTNSLNPMVDANCS